jgi:two-component system chemotaxis response regulator CheY
MSVLVVEDSLLVTNLASTLLRDLEFDRVDRACDGIGALQLLRSHEYRLVISDFVMTPMTGLDLLRTVRSHRHLREVCFLMMSGATSIEQVTAAYRAGADGYLVKPFSAATLYLKINKAFQRQADARIAAILARRPQR